MKIMFRKDNWIKDDLLNLVDMISHDDYDEEFFNRLGIYPDKNASKIGKKFKKYFDLEKMGLDYFNNERFRYIVLSVITEKSLLIENIEDIPGLIRDMCNEETMQKIIQGLCVNNEHDFKEDEINIDRANLEEVKDFLNKIDIDSKVKWQIYKFLVDPEELFLKLADSLDKLIPSYVKEMKKHEGEIDDISQHIEEQLKIEGVDFYKDLISGTVRLSDYENIYVRPAYIEADSLLPVRIGKDMYLQVGYKFRETIELVRGKSDQENMLNVIGMVTDPVKYKILSYTKDKAVYGKQLCELTGLSKAALSYHTTNLINMGLLCYEKKGNKTYYSSRKDTIVNALEMFLENIK